MRHGLASLEWIWLDLHQSARGLLRSPAFSAAAIISLALGIGANTAIFSFVNAILLKRMPVPEPDRLVTFGRVDHGESSGVVWRMTTVDELAKRGSAFSGIFGTFPKAISFSSGDTPQWLMGELVTGQYFQTLEVKPAVGRLLTPDDVRDATANPGCVISYGLWQRVFAGDPGVVGRNVFLNGHAYRVVGVTARGFYGSNLDHRTDLQIPATRIADFMPGFSDETGVSWLKTLSWLSPLARLKPGLGIAAAQEQTQRELQQIRLEDSHGHVEKEATLLLKDGSQGFNSMRSSFGRPIMVLMLVVALVLLIACANLASLLVARAQARAKEFAVRLSIGAGRARLIRQLFTESLLLAACGGISGILLSFWVVRTLLAFLNSGRSPVSALRVTPDLNVLLFSIALSFVTAILFGLVPAWQATNPDLASGLKLESSGRLVSRQVVRRGLVVVQIALSLVVVFAAGLLTQTLRRLKTTDLGFQPEQVIALSVDPSANGHSSAEASLLLDEILARTRTLPGVKAASLAVSTPNGSMAISMSIGVPGYTPKGSGDDVVAFNFVSPQYFSTLGQRLLRGRDFDARDRMDAPRVAIVTEKLGRHFYGDQDPLGRKFNQGGGDVEIVGMVQDVRDQSIKSGPQETVYLAEKQSQTSGLTLLVRGVHPAETITSLLAIVKSIDPRMPVFSVHTLDAEVEAGLSTERILGYLSTLFAALATLLAGIGLYGVIAYSVARRTREIGIRFAIGAQKRNVAGVFARESFVLLLVGLVAGGPLAVASGHALGSLLFGVAPADPFTLLLSVLLLAIAALLAMAVPLWRASRVDPITALRYE